MKLKISVDVNPERSGYKNDDDLKNNIADFVYKWLVEGADSRSVDFSVRSVHMKNKKRNCKEVCKWLY